MQKVDTKKVAKEVDVVAKDRNWVQRINNEMGSESKWDNQWGYLSGGFSPQKVEQKASLARKIQKLEEEVKEIDANVYSRASDTYGQGKPVEIFANNKYNMKKNIELRALERRLPKNWKKQKWTPPVDPYDPLTNFGKKKK